MSLPTDVAFRHANGLQSPPQPSSRTGNGYEGLRRSESTAQPSSMNPLVLSGPAMTGHTAMDVMLHTRQTDAQYAAWTQQDMARQVNTK